MAIMKMIEVVRDEKYATECGTWEFNRSYGQLMVDEDGNDLTTNGHWIMQLVCDDGDRESQAIEMSREVLADRFGFELVAMPPSLGDN